MKTVTYIIFLNFWAIILFSQDTAFYKAPEVLNMNDTIHTFSDHQDNVYYKHRLKPKQTLYSIADYFGTDLFTIYRLNPSLRSQVATIGDTIRVPFPKNGLLDLKQKSIRSIPVMYTVKPKDNIFRISRIMFKSDQSMISRFNNIKENGLNINDTLQLGWWHIGGIKEDSSLDTELTPLAQTFKNSKEAFKFQSLDGKIVQKKGMATWNKNDNSQSGFYVIHKYAKPGTIVELTNPMYNRVAYAKVLAQLPPNTYQREVLVVVSPALANYLGVIDSKFFIKMRYLQQ